jgi:hypothetical protein
MIDGYSIATFFPSAHRAPLRPNRSPEFPFVLQKIA